MTDLVLHIDARGEPGGCFLPLLSYSLTPLAGQPAHGCRVPLQVGRELVKIDRYEHKGVLYLNVMSQSEHQNYVMEESKEVR